MRWFNQRKLWTLEKQTEITLINASSSSVMRLNESFLCCFVSSICMSFRDLLLWIIYGKIVTSVICAGKKWHDKWFDIKGCIDTQWTKDFFNWITNILILCYPSKQALTLSISSVKLTIDRSVRVLLSPVDVSLLLEISWNSWKYWASATPHIWALCPCLPWQCDTEAGEYLIDFLNTELCICEWHSLVGRYLYKCF